MKKEVNKNSLDIPFYKQIECEHGWTDQKGFSRCDLGTGCSIALDSYCTKEDCPIYEEE